MTRASRKNPYRPGVGVLIKAQPETITLLGRGAATLALDPGILAKLQSLFVAVNPIFPAEHQGPVFTLPIFGGVIAPDGSSGTIETPGLPGTAAARRRPGLLG